MERGLLSGVTCGGSYMTVVHSTRIDVASRIGRLEVVTLIRDLALDLGDIEIQEVG